MLPILLIHRSLELTFLYPKPIFCYNLLTPLTSQTAFTHKHITTWNSSSSIKAEQLFFLFHRKFCTTVRHCVSLLLPFAFAGLLPLGNLLGRGFALGESWQWGLDLTNTTESAEIHIPHNWPCLYSRTSRERTPLFSDNFCPFFLSSLLKDYTVLFFFFFGCYCCAPRPLPPIKTHSSPGK